MAIFYPSKTGDAMGTQSTGRFSKRDRAAWAKMKAEQEERALFSNPRTYEVKRAASKFEETVRKQRRAAGLI